MKITLYIYLLTQQFQHLCSLNHSKFFMKSHKFSKVLEICRRFEQMDFSDWLI